MPTDAEGMEIVSRGRDAGSSEDEILEMLVAAGFTTEDAQRQIETIHRIPEDPEEFRARLESAGFPPDVAAWEVDRHELGRKLEAMLTDAGFGDEAARDAYGWASRRALGERCRGCARRSQPRRARATPG